MSFFTEVLGFELRTDVEVWPGARMIEVVPPGSSVGRVLLPPDSQIPVAIRLGTSDARPALETLRQSKATLHIEELIRMDGVPAMFSFADPQPLDITFTPPLGKAHPDDTWTCVQLPSSA